MNLTRIELLKLDVPSKYTGRIYSTGVVYNAINDENFQFHLKRGGFHGEFSLPSPGEVSRLTIKNIFNISHNFSALYIEDSVLYGDLQFADTSKGKQLRNLLSQGVTPRFTLRGYGNVDQDHVVSDLHIISFDYNPENKKETLQSQEENNG